MNDPKRPPVLAGPRLHQVLLAALDVAQPADAADIEARWLQEQRTLCGGSPREALEAWLESPPKADALLHLVASALQLSPMELVAVALASAVETDMLAGRAIAWLQAPLGGSRPTVGLVFNIVGALGTDASLSSLADGKAHASGLLVLESDGEAACRPLPEQACLVPLPLALALREGAAHWPGVELVEADPRSAVESLRTAAERQAHALKGETGLAVRAGHPRESRNAAALIAASLGMRAAIFEQEPQKGVGVWLALSRAMPVFCLELAPGEMRNLRGLPGYRGPLLVASGPEGSFAYNGDSMANWSVPLPQADERRALWQRYTSDESLAGHLGVRHRYDATRIDRLGRASHHEASLDDAAKVGPQHVSRAARRGLAADLGTLAELMPDDIGDEALIIPDGLRDGLSSLVYRCELRESLADELGLAARTRYKPGVRGLFVGPSGTGKTLAAGWLATRLGLPLYRVDVAAVTSKYIGETEKNLSQLFARAEHAEVVLLFDEADSLFGKRTEVKESNDRFANTQTNYLLQRIESFEGIAILTSNSRTRFDAAFTRRLDAILEFPQPTPEERRALWIGHLGERHALSSTELNRLAAACDLAGGHIRNAVLGAAATARAGSRPIAYLDVAAGVARECRKLGKPVPMGLGVEGL